MPSQQQIASDPSNSSWVFASAGSGKTKILTDRVLRLLLDGTAPNKILCLTFTKVGAAEMQSRINSRLVEWVLCDEDELRKKLTDLSGKIPTKNQLEKARTLLSQTLDENAKIKAQTIHSFCQTLIKIFPFEANVKPDFEVLESNQEKLLLEQAQKEVLKKAHFDDFLKKLVLEINAKLHEASLSELISNLLGKKENFILLKEKFFGVAGIIDQIFKNFSLNKGETESRIFDEFLEKINLSELSKFVDQLENSSLVGNRNLAEGVKNFINKKSPEDFSDYKILFFTKEGAPRKLNKEINDNPVLSTIASNQQILILEFSDKFNSLKIANDTALILHFIDQILENYSRLKWQNSFLDYDDLIIQTNKLLANQDFSDWVKMKMDGSFDHILIDESQDTNHRQWSIIKALSEDFFSGESAANKDRSIFIVGDEKQSIYSFQGAEPNISAEIFSYFEKKLDGQLKKIELNNSFRSVATVLDAVDKVFSTPERKSAISKVSEFKSHIAVRGGKGKFEIWPQIKIEKKEKEPKNYEWKINFSESDEEKAAQILARNIANKIGHWVENKRILESRLRPVKYGDFMILLRNKTNGFAQFLSESLSQNKIPFSSVNKTKFSENLLIQDLLAAAKFALLADDDLNLSCLLKSPFFEISEEDLLEICLRKNGDSSSVFKALGDIEKYSKIKNSLDEFIAKSQELNAAEFFYFLIFERNHRTKFIAEFGHEGLETINKFLLFVADFCQNFSPNLQKFLEFVEKIDPEIFISFDDGNSVKITTIHSAKGLQAPIVIIPDCSYDFNRLLNSREEISVIDFGEEKIPLWCSKKSDENFILKKHRKEKLQQAKDEYLRLLYVAMTRAEDELYISGFGQSSDSENWYEIIKNSLPEFFDEMAFEKENTLLEIKNILPDEEINIPAVASDDKRRKELEPIKNQINLSQIKGKLIHKILEIFGKNHFLDKDFLQNLVQELIEKEQFLDKENKADAKNLVLKFLFSKKFAELFSNKTSCEVEIADGGKLRRIDLLIEKESEVLIIDYKSDESASDEATAEYLQQLNDYKKLVQKIYPNKQISCQILWLRFLDVA